MKKTRFIKNIILQTLLLLAINVAAAGPVALTGVNSSRFRTLKVTNPDNFMAPPVIRLGSDDRLVITFDEIGDNYSQLQYRLVHCNADWTPSRLTESEFIDGFNIADIEDYAYSENTFVHFVNYRLEFPNESTRLLHSGNYLLEIFDRDEPSETLLQVRFMVSEENIGVSGRASGITDRGHNTEWQQLDLTVDLNGIERANPYQDVTLTIIQNGVESSRRKLPRPLRVEGNTLFYQHTPELIYPAGNEYRRFESISNNFPGMHVDSLKYMGSNYHVWLKQDAGRALRNYEFDSTQHGRFLVREYNATDSDLGADYITVHFALEMPLLRDADIYVDGEMTHDRFDDTNRMVYDPESRLYRLQMPLKQGAYNYRYVAIPRQNPTPSAELTEGNKYETRNEYWVACYYHPPGSRADRLLSLQVINL